MKKTVIALVVGAALMGSTLPALASASTLSTSQIQAVTSLLQVFGTDSTTIANVQLALGGAQTTAATTTVNSSASTTAFSSDMIGFLRLGDKGDGVKYLQTLLAADPSIYPNGLISGYFGALTQAALKLYQHKHGLDQVGFVGPKTLKDLDDDLQQNPLGSENNGNGTSTVSIGDKHLCAIVPPGHLIAPGWLKHNGGEHSDIPTCQTLPPGISGHVDGDNNESTTPPVTDVTTPVISAIAVSNLASTSATINWNTNENATSKVYFGTANPLVLSTATNVSSAVLGTTHSMGLTGLATSTAYFYVVQSADAANNTATSSQATFTTPAI